MIRRPGLNIGLTITSLGIYTADRVGTLGAK